MIHYTCDLCGRVISRFEKRYRVLIFVEARPADRDDDDDSPDSREDWLFDEDEEELEDDPLNRDFTLDLCGQCANLYVRDPLRVRLPKKP